MDRDITIPAATVQAFPRTRRVACRIGDGAERMTVTWEAWSLALAALREAGTPMPAAVRPGPPKEG
jgi:hypothetical protein